MRRRLIALALLISGALAVGAGPAGAVQDGPGCGGFPEKKPVIVIHC